MDIKMLMIGILMGSLIFLTGIGITMDVASTYNADTTGISTQLTQINQTQTYINNDMNETATSMKSLFTNSSATTSTQSLSELDSLYKAAGGVARISVNSLKYVGSTINMVATIFPGLGLYIGFAIVAFTIALIISIAYLVFFRIPK